jgi:hypothetical protein
MSEPLPTSTAVLELPLGSNRTVVLGGTNVLSAGEFETIAPACAVVGGGACEGGGGNTEVGLGVVARVLTGVWVAVAIAGGEEPGTGGEIARDIGVGVGVPVGTNPRTMNGVSVGVGVLVGVFDGAGVAVVVLVEVGVGVSVATLSCEKLKSSK